MNDFLKMVAHDIKINGKEYSSNDIYLLLKYYGIKKDVSLVSDIETFYQDFLGSLKNSLVRYDTRTLKYGENATHYISFYASEKADYLEAVKVYFPVKYEYLISALKTVFLYLIRNNIAATVKFHVKATNEAIVIRFYKSEDVLPFIHYCNNNFVLKELLVPVEPFIATIFGIGVVKDDNTVKTYQALLSELLKDYLDYKKSEQLLEQVSDLDFLDYLRKREQMEENDIIRFDMKQILKNIVCILNSSSPIDEKNLI